MQGAFVADEDEFPTAQLTVREMLLGQVSATYLIVLEGGAVGQSYRLGLGDNVIGRYAQADVRIRQDGISRRHALVRGVGSPEVVVDDLGSTNGTFVNGSRVASQVLHDGDLIQIGPHTVLKFRVQDSVEEQSQRRLRELATRDALTGLLNRRGFDDHLQREFSYARRHGRPLSVVLFDLDHFKLVNDRYGHAAGDAVLRHVALRVADLLRREDHFARHGGEEFAILARELDERPAIDKAEALREAVAATPVPTPTGDIAVTMSVGVATHRPGRFEDAAALVHEADRCLYRAKAAGRNCVRSADPLSTAEGGASSPSVPPRRASA
ncbi:MAG: GGDEF domain-containing protein [Vicinamibacterales bacterium]